jgi:hypothetical protein
MVLIMQLTTLFVDEKAKVGTLCPTLDISTLNGASVHHWASTRIATG